MKPNSTYFFAPHSGRLLALIARGLPAWLAYLALGVALSSGKLQAQTTFTYDGTADGAWSTGPWVKSGTATLATYPGQAAGEDHRVVINGPSAITMTLDVSVTNASITRMDVLSLATLDISANTLNIAGPAGTAGQGGKVSLNGGQLTVSGAYAIDSTVAIGAASTFYASAAISSGMRAPSLKLFAQGVASQALSLPGRTGRLQVQTGSNVSITSPYTLTDSLIIRGTYAHLATGNTLTHEGTSISGAGTGSFRDIVFTSASTKSVSGSYTLLGSLANTGGSLTFLASGRSIFNGGVQAITGTGAITFGNVTITGSAQLAVNRGGLTMAGTATGTATDGSDAALGIATAGTASLSSNALGQITFTGANASLSLPPAKLAYTGKFTINASGINIVNDLSIGSLDVSSTRTLTLAKKLTLGQDMNVAALATFSQTADTTRFNRAGAQLILGTGVITFNHLKLLGSGTKSAANSFITKDIFAAPGVILSSFTVNVQIRGNWTLTGANYQAVGGQTPTVTFSGTTAQTMTGGTTFYNLVVSNTGGVVSTGSSIINVPGGSTNVAAGAVLNLGSFTGQNLIAVSGSGTLQISAVAAGNTDFPSGNMTNFLAPTGLGTIEYNSANSYNVADAPPLDYFKLIFSGGGTKRLSAAVSTRGDVTIASGTTLDNNTVNITLRKGNLINNGIYFGGTLGDVAFNDQTANQQVLGTGVTAFTQLSLDKQGYNLVLGQAIRINTRLEFRSDGKLQLGTYDLTVGRACAIATNTAFSAACMIEQNGLASGGSLIMEGTAAADFLRTLPIGSAGVYAPVQYTALAATITGTGTIQVQTLPYSGAIINYLARYWRVATTGISSVSDARFRFFFASSEVTGTPNSVVRVDASSVESDPLGAQYTTGAGQYFGITGAGNTFLVRDWQFKKPDRQIVYYTFKTGVYSDRTMWTTNFTGASWDNPPDAGGPDANDRIVILPGKTCTMDVNGTGVDSVAIQSGGILDLAATTGHNWTNPLGLANINGQGTLRLSTGILPAGATWGTLVGAAGGTIEYYSFAGTLDATLNQYFNLTLSGTGQKTLSSTATRTVTVNQDMAILADSFILGGASFGVTLNIIRDLTVSAGAAIKVGGGSAHALSVGRSFVNNGKVRLTNQAAPFVASYYTAIPSSGYASLTMGLPATVGVSRLTCTGRTDLWSLAINRATTDSVVVTASDTAFFTLYGRNDQVGALLSNTTAGSSKALDITSGWLVLTRNIRVRSLTSAGIWRVGTSAGLMINGARLWITTVAGAQAMTVMGNFVLRQGYLDGGPGQGLALNIGTYRFITGVSYLSQITTINLGGTTSTLIINGGTLNIDGAGFTDVNFPRLHLGYTGQSWQFNGGVVNVRNPVTGTFVFKGGIVINANTSNTAAGGTINCYLSASTDPNLDFGVAIRPSIVNINVIAEAATTRNLWIGLVQWRDVATTRNYDPAQLMVRNRYNVLAGAGMDNGTKSFFFGDSAVFSPTSRYTAGGGATFSIGTNTNGIDGIEDLNIDLVLGMSGTVAFQNLLLDCSTDNINFRINGNCSATATSYQHFGANVALNLDLAVTGTVNENGTVVGTGKFSMTGAVTATLSGTGTAGFAWLEINKTGATQVTMTYGFTVTRLDMTAGNMDLAGNTLTIPNTGTINNVAPSATRMIISTTGGGLRRQFKTNQTEALLYPLGAAGKYRPVTVTAINGTGAGSIRLAAVNGVHPNITAPGTADSAIAFYWRASGNSFNVVSLKYEATYLDADFPASNPTRRDDNYVVGRYYYGALPPLWGSTVAYSTHPANILTYNANGSESVDLTVGRPICFVSDLTFISITTGNWDVPNTWRTERNGVTVENPSTIAPNATNHIVFVTGGFTVTMRAVSGAVITKNLRIDATSILDLDTTTCANLHNFGVAVIGNPNTGRMRISSSRAQAVYPLGNFSAVGTGATVEYYRKTRDFTLPSVASYGNLVLNPSQGGGITLPPVNVAVAGTLVCTATSPDSGYIYTSSAATNALAVSSTTTIGLNTRFVIRNTSQAVALTWSGSVTVTGWLLCEPGGTTYHTLTLSNSITASGRINLQPGTAAQNRCGVLFDATNTGGNFSGAAPIVRVPYLRALRNSSSNTLTVNAANFTLLGDPATAATIDVSNCNLVLATGLATTVYRVRTNAVWNIPSGSFVEIQHGSLLIDGASGAVTLDGRLITRNAAKVKISGPGIGTAANSLYSGVTANSTLDLQSTDSLIVAGQWRNDRQISFRMTRGTFIIARGGVATTSVSNLFWTTGSTINLTGGLILIANSTTANPNLVMPLATNGVGVTLTSIQLGDINTTSGAAFAANVGTPLFNLTLSGATPAAVKPTLANVGAARLELLGSLTLDAGTATNLSAKDLWIGGNLTANGSMNATGSIVQFNSLAADQTVTGTGLTSCKDLIFTPTTGTTQLNMSAAGNLICTGTLQILRGVMNAGANNITVRGDVTNFGSHIATTGEVILSGAAALQNMYGNSATTYSRLRLDNALNVRAYSDMSVTLGLTFVNGLLDIDVNSLILGSTALFTASGSDFSAIKGVRVAGTIGSGGVTRSFPAGTFNRVFPLITGLGTVGAPYTYVPARYMATANTAVGTITIKPVVGGHPATTDVGSKELAFYWSVSSTGFAGLSIRHSYRYVQTMANGRGNEATYIPSRYTGAWQVGVGSVDPVNDSLRIQVSNTVGVGYIGGDYTAGESTEFTAGAGFISNGTGGGAWNIASSWLGAAVPTPGSAVQIRRTDVITVPVLVTISQAVVTIDTNATLRLAASANAHDFGSCFGLGALSLEDANFPAGNFGTFTSGAGGTVEYQGAGYTITSTRSVYNNLRIAGTGTIGMADVATTLNGNLTVTSGTFENLQNKKLIVRGNTTVSSGSTFTAGSAVTNENLEMYGNFANSGTFTAGNTVAIFRGSGQQSISGSQEPVFSTLQVNKPDGALVLLRGTTVAKQVTLTQGLIRLRSSDLTLDETTIIKPDFVTSQSFIDTRMSGRLVRRILSLASPVIASMQLYPVGDSLEYSPITININSCTPGPGALVGVSVRPVGHPARMSANRYLARYWAVSNTNVATPVIDVAYTYPSASEIVDLYPIDPRPITAYRYSTDGWADVAGSFAAAAKTFTYNNSTIFGDYTGGTGMGDNTSLPVTVGSFAARRLAKGISVEWDSRSEAGVRGYVVERSTDGKSWSRLGFIASQANGGNSQRRLSYTLLDGAPIQGTNYYRLISQDLDGRTEASQTVSAQWGIKADAGLTVVPNPGQAASQRLMLNGYGAGPIRLTVQDITGRLLHKVELRGTDQDTYAYPLSEAGLAPGVYVISAHSDEASGQARIIVR